MSVKYTDPALVTGTRITDTPRSGQTASGYGGKIPTRYQIHYRRYWYRVYMMQYGNSGTPFIHSLGEDLVLDIDTRYALEALAEGGRTSDPTTKNGEHCAEHAENGTCIHSDHTA